MPTNQNSVIIVPIILQGIGLVFTALFLDGGKIFKDFIGVSLIFWGILVALIVIVYFIRLHEISQYRDSSISIMGNKLINLYAKYGLVLCLIGSLFFP